MIGLTKRIGRTVIVIVAVGAMAIGCTESSPTGPGPVAETAPTLPDANQLRFDFGFFDAPAKSLTATQQNFFNAAIRVAVLQTATQIVLTPPVAAFAIAVHSIPSRQPDGSWLWVYTFVNGDEEAQIRLRGKHTTGRTEWEMRLTNLFADPPIDNELWFDGETRNEATEGDWTFHDFTRPGKPEVGRIEWRSGEYSEELRFLDLDENPGDEIAYVRDGALCRIDYHDASENADWFIRWDEIEGDGSLRWEEYHGGEEACWDTERNDTDCGPAL